MKATVNDDRILVPPVHELGVDSDPARRFRVRRIAEGLSVLVAILMVVASGAGLLVEGMYFEGPWAREALRGGDLTTLVLAAPTLVVSLILVRRGSRRAIAVWIGALAYAVYDYAYYVFGATFKDIFLLHVAAFTLSIWATALAAVSLDLRSVARAFPPDRAAASVGGFLMLVGTLLGGLWITLSIRQAITDELMADLPVRGVHLVFAIDLSLLAPSLVVAGALLWRRRPIGIVFGAAMTVMGALYQVNLLLAGVFQANADVPGVKAFPLEGVVLAAGFALGLAVLFRPRRRVHGHG